LVGVYRAWQEIVRHFPKHFRYSLGAKISNLFTDVLERVFLASITSGRKKLEILQSASVKLDTLKFFLQVAWESKALVSNQYVLLSEKLDRVGRMLGGWQKDTLNKLSKTNPATEAGKED